MPAFCLGMLLLQCTADDADQGQGRQPASRVEFITVDGMPVSAEEFRFHLSRNRAAIFSIFSRNHQAQFGADFWTTEYEGVTPLERAKKLTLEAMMHIKCAQGLAQRLGVAVEPDYEAMMQDLQSTNAERKQAAARGQVIYGPVEYTPYTWFAYLYSNMEIHIKDSLLSREMRDRRPGNGPSLPPENDTASAMEQSQWRREAINAAYERILDSLVRHAEVRVNRDAYNALQMPQGH